MVMAPEPAWADRPEPRHVVVVGAGRMGADIALAFALNGWRCSVLERDAAVRGRAQSYWAAETKRLKREMGSDDLGVHDKEGALDWQSVALLVECVFEDLDLKRSLLQELEGRLSPNALIATNTSSLPITDVMSELKQPGRGAGLHFMVPAHVMLAVEITRGAATTPDTMSRLVSWMEAMDKVPIVLNRDVPGMLINRIQHAMYREIYHLIDEGIVSSETVDRAVRFGFGFRYPILGPVVSRDIHGLPVHLEVSKQIYPTLHNGTAPGRLLSQLVEDGHVGVKSGRGFYTWDPETVEQRLVRFTELLEQALLRVERPGEPTEF